MIYKATKLIQAELEESNIKCTIEETPSSSYVRVGYNCDNVSSIVVRFISSDDDNDVAARIWTLAKATPAKRAAVLEAINELNAKYRYVFFYLDDDNEVNVGYDFPLRTTNVGAIAREILNRMVNIADEAYPILMKALWS